MASVRHFPFSPRSTREIEIGDLVAVPVVGGGWGCLQVTDLKRRGTGALTTLVVGVLDWHGPEAPTAASVLGSPVTEQGLTRVELFTQGGYRITGTCAVGPNPWPSNYRDSGIGTVTKVWGWRAAAGRVGRQTP